MSRGDRLIIAGGFLLLLTYAVVYWSLQPTCGTGEVRVRGFFMTHCVIGR
jgi:hypothetical protein